MTKKLMYQQTDYPDDAARDTDRRLPNRGTRKAVRFGRIRHRPKLTLGRERCLNLLRDHPKRDELLDVLIDAGESAWARGAHEVNPFVYTAHLVISLTSLFS